MAPAMASAGAFDPLKSKPKAKTQKPVAEAAEPKPPSQADAAYQAGRFEEAEKLLREALAAAEGNGENDPETAKLVNNLGNVLRKQGKLEEARPLVERALASSTAIFGRDHPNTDTSRANLVELLDEMKDSAAALKLLEETVKEEEAQPDSPAKKMRLAGGLRGLAAMQVKMQKIPEAEVSLKKSLALFEEVHGAAHPSTGSTLAAYANLLRTQGRNEDALPLYERLLEMTSSALGPKHPQCGIAHKALAQVKQALGQHKEALENAELGVGIMRQVHGGVHMPLVDFLETLAACAESAGEPDRAAAAREEAGKVKEQVAQKVQLSRMAIDVKKASKTIGNKIQSGEIKRSDMVRPTKYVEVEYEMDAPLLNPVQERLRKKLESRKAASSA